MSKIVFLDFDGVMLPFGSYLEVDVGLLRSTPHAHLDLIVSKTPKDTVERLKALANQGGAKFVLISTWRKVFPESFLKQYLEELGLFEHFHEDWCARWKMSSDKGNDIGFWLGDHRKAQRDCLVIDDEDLFLKERYGFRALWHLRPDPEKGFTHNNLVFALQLLKKGNATDGKAEKTEA